jgi:hypothetical protein
MKVQVRNMRVPVATMRVKEKPASPWRTTSRSYAFFVYNAQEGQMQ